MYRVTKRLYIAKNNDASTPFTASSPLLAQPQLRPGRGSRRTPSSASLRHSRGSKHSPKGIPPKKILSSGAKQKHIADFGQTKHIYRIYIYMVVDQYSFILEWSFIAEKIFRGSFAASSRSMVLQPCLANMSRNMS